jgi:type IV pilus assembly protein PilX
MIKHTIRCHRSTHRQTGVALIMALIMLAVISMLASFNARNAASTEAIMGTVRTSGLAKHAAEAALRYCENAVLQIASGTGTLVSLPTVVSYATTPTWINTGIWDSTNTAVFVVPSSSVNVSGVSVTYARAPECIVEQIPIVQSGSFTLTYSLSFVVTARGFGPEVQAADSARSRPKGSEVWMQSTIELE